MHRSDIIHVTADIIYTYTHVVDKERRERECE